MKSSLRLILIAALLAAVSTSQAADSGLRVTCEGEDVGAEVLINGKFRGECPIDLKVPAGQLKLVVRKKVDAERERVFEQDIRMGEDAAKKVEAQLSAPRLNAAAQKRADERLATERTQAVARDAKVRAEFAAALASGALQASFRDCADCPEMLAIPPGSFEMGSNNGDADEEPVHRVNISRAFALGKTEVTQAQWRAVMGNNPSIFKNCGDNCPVENVSWDDAQAFIQKLNAKTGKQYRLPSEAEWEYACRADGKNEYCGGNNLASVAWYGASATPVGNSAKTTNRVAGKQANAFGLFDMSGNVWEWVEDSAHDSYAGAPTDGSAWPGDGAKRVFRGGSWLNGPQFARAAVHVRGGPAYRDNDGNIGFRLARMLP